MTKLQEWLNEQGLAQCAGVLADNDIDFDILSDLAESDLEKLGLSLGHRRKLLKALAALQPAPTQPEASPTTPETQKAEPGCDRTRQTPSLSKLKLIPLWDLLRSDPRFEKIVASLAPKK